ncbi:hypothetical protein [Nonomuraea typhae]|uniref:Chitinase n=1 Tax=Nonomuraea typhae TaxID=2603600 RepID=A0ABW7Z956_9ACTN
MQPHLVKYLAALLTGLGLSLAPALPASSQGNDTSSAQAVSLGREWVGWFSTLQHCTATGQDYVRHNGASGYACQPSGTGYDLYVTYP